MAVPLEFEWRNEKGTFKILTTQWRAASEENGQKTAIIVALGNDPRLVQSLCAVPFQTFLDYQVYSARHSHICEMTPSHWGTIRMCFPVDGYKSPGHIGSGAHSVSFMFGEVGKEILVPEWSVMDFGRAYIYAQEKRFSEYVTGSEYPFTYRTFRNYVMIELSQSGICDLSDAMYQDAAGHVVRNYDRIKHSYISGVTPERRSAMGYRRLPQSQP